jgi:hypothetical protein
MVTAICQVKERDIRYQGDQPKRCRDGHSYQTPDQTPQMMGLSFCCQPLNYLWDILLRDYGWWEDDFDLLAGDSFLFPTS